MAEGDPAARAVRTSGAGSRLAPRAWLALVAWITVLLLGGLFLVQRLATEPVAYTVSDVATVSTVRQVASADDAGKPGTLRSVLGQHRFRQMAQSSGPSPDVLRFRFDAPARILGANVSVDIWKMPLVEFAVAIGAENYGITARDWIIHTSDQNTGRSKIDEAIMLPGDGLLIAAGESVDVVAWLLNNETQERWVSPEIIIYYEWIE